MRKLICVLCVVLLSTVALAQDVAEKPFGTSVEVDQENIYTKVATEGMPEWEIKAKAATRAAMAFPSKSRLKIAIAIAEAQGLETYVFGSGCLAIFQGGNILVGPVMEGVTAGTKAFVVIGLPGEYCDGTNVPGACRDWPSAAPQCTTTCDGHFDNYVITCFEGSEACCGCNRIWEPGYEVQFPCGFCAF